MSLTASQLDTIRAEYMAAFLTPEEADRSIWLYDVTRASVARSIAVDRQDYDAMKAAADNPTAKFALTGPGIEDTYFTSLPEFFSALHWLVHDHFRGLLAENHFENSRVWTANRRAKKDYLCELG
jgi:hypothetical protein